MYPGSEPFSPSCLLPREALLRPRRCRFNFPIRYPHQRPSPSHRIDDTTAAVNVVSPFEPQSISDPTGPSARNYPPLPSTEPRFRIHWLFELPLQMTRGRRNSILFLYCFFNRSARRRCRLDW